MCYPVCLIVHIKDPFLLIAHVMVGAGFPYCCLSDHLPYIRHHITIHVLIKHFNPSFNVLINILDDYMIT